jgi:hypothetical protein
MESPDKVVAGRCHRVVAADRLRFDAQLSPAGQPSLFWPLRRSHPCFQWRAEGCYLNIKFSRQIEAAITAYYCAGIAGRDILLLQEMDEAGVETIAQALQYNYVYYPASIHTENSRNFGNAILSKWPLLNPAKVLLPYENPRNGQQRIATRAEAQVGERVVLVYSLHSETFWLGPAQRAAQIEALAQDIDPAAPYVIVGGDFNSFTQAASICWRGVGRGGFGAGFRGAGLPCRPSVWSSTSITCLLALCPPWLPASTPIPPPAITCPCGGGFSLPPSPDPVFSSPAIFLIRLQFQIWLKTLPFWKLPPRSGGNQGIVELPEVKFGIAADSLAHLTNPK